MIDKFDRVNDLAEVEVQIIPRLKEFNCVTLEPGDTLVAYYDPNRFSLDLVQSTYDLLRNAFPNNNVLCLDKTVHLGVIKEKI